jgi:farnesyl-diphosphate farnesyltransferase
VRAFETDAQLDAYCYDVAGIVGVFWTRMMAVCSPALAVSFPCVQMETWGTDYGKGLQLINVLKDIAKDYRIGRVYLPLEILRPLGISPEDLANPGAYSRVRPVILNKIASAISYLRSGESYVLCIPRRYLRLRLAALWPLLIGLATLECLAVDRDLLDSTRPHKISRKVLRRLLWRSCLAVFSNRLLTYWFRRYREDIEGHLR